MFSSVIQYSGHIITRRKVCEEGGANQRYQDYSGYILGTKDINNF